MNRDEADLSRLRKFFYTVNYGTVGPHKTQTTAHTPLGKGSGEKNLNVQYF